VAVDIKLDTSNALAATRMTLALSLANCPGHRKSMALTSWSARRLLAALRTRIALGRRLSENGRLAKGGGVGRPAAGLLATHVARPCNIHESAKAIGCVA
jgi:hypothetical protein